ncbi:WXG100 family type VII secretion target [Kutzneria kofuensis]|uniref:ESAT-6-like protein n=1 Tax=Kutzneria kofuensis TaxID=103725 RepID=A0A7W9NKS0_9PSEU|nr:WXG100 family type VII secretion target [Kutzneria kofuensis]MBB5896315.1 WXG100 family type VII secretion target [Kutzneria kofuensis]
MSGVINYDYGSIDTGVSQMKAFNAQVEQKISALKSQVQGLLQEFKGAASSSYDTCAQRISQDLNQSNERLNHLGGNVSKGASNFQSADAANARRFA